MVYIGGAALFALATTTPAARAPSALRSAGMKTGARGQGVRVAGAKVMKGVQPVIAIFSL